ILGIWGAGGATGKGVGEDIVNKKKSLPVVYGLERSEPLRQLYRSDVLDQTQQQAAMELLDALSARDYCQRMANEKFELAVEILDGASIRNEAQNRLRTIAQFLLERQR
ncbi:MAG: polyprenyl synthetase family protein, partial [Anaerolineae bacterium]|nr:polyprenyl synthetase family protein [Anaerolineae bacterium]